MDLSTTYLGLELSHPLMPGASPLLDDLDTARRLEDAGAPAVVMRSLFEEQITVEQLAAHAFMDGPADSYAQALSYLPSPQDFRMGPEAYLEQLARLKEALDIPVIGSLNGTTRGGWLEYAGLMVEAGADALELNIYDLATDGTRSSSELEKQSLEMVRELSLSVGVPLAVKLSPFYTALANHARALEEAGAQGLVLFNRFYQPDIDVDALEVTRQLRFSDPSELLLRVRWLAILSGQIQASLAASGGVHGAVDAVKAIMGGAHAVQMVSALLTRGPEYLTRIRTELESWLLEHEYESVRQMRGSMSLLRCPDPGAYERANYIQILQSFRG